MKSAFWDEPGPIAIAHRGGDAAGAHTGNTLAAFEAAQKAGYRYSETDVILAASGELVTLHGAYNWLEAGFRRDITRDTLQKMTLDQIRATLKPGGGQVPTLEEVLKAFPKMKFIIDLKTDQAAAPLAEFLKRLKVFDRVCVTGFGYNRNLAFLRACRGQTVNAGLTVGRGLRFRNINMLMLKSGRLKDMQAIFLHHSLVSPPMISLIHRRGFKAVVWTANSSLGIKHAVRSGTDGIISDRTFLLQKVLKDNKKKAPRRQAAK